MPVDDLGKLGMRMRAARNEMGLTQQRLSDMCHVSIIPDTPGACRYAGYGKG